MRERWCRLEWSFTKTRGFGILHLANFFQLRIGLRGMC